MEKPSKTFKRVRKQREDEFIPPYDPRSPYKRNFEKTHMSWPTALLYSKSKNANYLLLFILVISLIIGAFGVWMLYKAVMWFLEFLPQLVAS